MKKHGIIIAAILMGIVFVALISVIIDFHNRMTQLRKEQFDTGVTRCLFRVSKALELEETFKGLKEDLHAIGSSEIEDSLSNDPMADMHLLKDPEVVEDDIPLHKTNRATTHSPYSSKGLTLGQMNVRNKYEFSEEMRTELKKRYIYQQQQLNKVIYSILYSSNNTPIEKRINFKKLDNFIKTELLNNGIDILYHFTVTTADGRVIYRCQDYTDEGIEHSYKQVLMPNNSPSNTGLLIVNFPSIDRYIYKSARYVVVAVIFIVILVLVYIYDKNGVETAQVERNEKRLCQQYDSRVENPGGFDIFGLANAHRQFHCQDTADDGTPLGSDTRRNATPATLDRPGLADFPARRQAHGIETRYSRPQYHGRRCCLNFRS